MKVSAVTLSSIVWVLGFTTSPLAAIVGRAPLDFQLDRAQETALAKRVTPNVYARSSSSERRMTIVFCKTFTRSLLVGYQKWENIADFTKNQFGQWLEDRVVNPGNKEFYRANWQGFVALLESTINIMPSQQLRDAFNSRTTTALDTYYSVDIRLESNAKGEAFQMIWKQAFFLINEYLKSGLGLSVSLYDADANLDNWDPNPLRKNPYPKSKRGFQANEFSDSPSDCILGTLNSDPMRFHDVPADVWLPWGPYSSGCGIDYCWKYWKKPCDLQFPPPN